MSRVAVVGGGASGLIAAGFAVRAGHNVTVFERNRRAARKVMITGKGRCNVTNDSDLSGLIAAVPTNGRFLYSAFSSFTPDDIRALLKDMGVETKVERGNRVFPVSDKAVDVVDGLIKFASGAEFVYERVNDITANAVRAEKIITDNGEYIFDSVIIATGGKSYPATGSTGDGYEFAKKLGHTVTELTPSLVPLVCHEGFISCLQGLSLKNISISVIDTKKNKSVYSDFGEMLFTHFGVSGPVILSASAHLRPMEERRYVISIDLKPALDIQTLDKRLQRDFGENANKDFINSLSKLLPRKLIPVIVQRSAIPPHSKVNQITKEQRLKFAEQIKNFTVSVVGFRPIEEAIITSGGVKVSEVDPKTMRSKILENVYFAGEILDVDAYTGGFNLQIAFSTGCVAGKNVL
jgi:predicted Rossmann fold flavoprotein